MPNQRRRSLSTTVSAAVALAVASPFAAAAVTELTESRHSENIEFAPAAVASDLPDELLGALSQGLSQFGINLPTGLTGSSGAPGMYPDSTGLYPGATGMYPDSTGLYPSASPGLTDPMTGMPSASPGLTDPATGMPSASPGLTDPATGMPSASPGLTSPDGLSTPGAMPGTTPSLTDPGLADPGLTNPSAMPGSMSPGLTNPTMPGAANTAPGLGMTDATGMPVGTGMDPGMDPSMGGMGAETYPILGDPSMGAMPATSTGGSQGGIVDDVMNAANQLGAGQAIDMIKSSMAGAMQGGGAPGAMAPPIPEPAAAPIP